MKLDYSPQYYDRLSNGSSRSAAAVVPFVMEYIAPTSVVDLGCGTGVWLAEFKRQGVRQVLGIDGSHIRQTWQNRALHVAVDLAAATRDGDVIVLVDEDQFGQVYLPGRVLRPFIERDGGYFGPPSDDTHAIEEIVRMQQEGAGYLAFGWPAFWWLKHYKEFSVYLAQNHTMLLKNDNLVLYRLNP